jgi:hypothetical protein
MIDERKVEGKKKPKDDVSAVTNAVRNMTGLNLAGLVVVGMFAVRSAGAGEGVRTVALGLLVAVASCLVGAVLGFVFGIPRAVQEGASAERAAEVDAATRRRAGYRANTNLERISDWLATIIVGVGLTELKEMPGHLKSLAEFVAPGLGDSQAATVAAAVIVVYYTIGGFLLGYLWTRLYFLQALHVAEQRTEE